MAGITERLGSEVRGSHCTRHVRSFALLWALIGLTGCSTPFDPSATFYIIMEADQQEPFVRDLAALSHAHGMIPATARMTPDHGPSLHVLEARGHFLRLWAQNNPLSAHECGGDNDEAGVDPHQFVVSVYPAFSLPNWDKAKALSAELSAELRAKGYRVRPKPACAIAELARERG